MPTLDDVKKQYGGDDKNAELAYYQTYLAHTDYVAAKLAEATFTGEKLAEDYTSILQQRQTARQQIDALMQTNKST